MQAVAVCRSCGKTIEKQFMYCPWCGTPQSEKSDAGAHIDPVVFERLEQLQSSECRKRLERIGRSLDALEEEISHILLRLEISE